MSDDQARKKQLARMHERTSKQPEDLFFNVFAILIIIQWGKRQILLVDIWNVLTMLWKAFGILKYN